jgi:phage tail protein X
MNWFDTNWTFKDDYYALKGERWDQISQKVYGRPDLYMAILDANQLLTDDNRRGLSIVDPINLKIPDLDLTELESYNLPEWRIAANAST